MVLSCVYENDFLAFIFLPKNVSLFYQSQNVDVIHVQAPKGTISEPSRRDTT